MSFNEALATQPDWVRLWVMWMTGVTVASMVGLVFYKPTRRDALIIFAASVAIALSMQWLYLQIGFVRLLGIVHVIIWTPLSIYLWQRVRHPEIVQPFRTLMWLLLWTIVISLGFDIIDVVRYLLGERESLVPARL